MNWSSGRRSNRPRRHSALGGKAPIDRVCELLPKTSLTEQV